LWGICRIAKKLKKIDQFIDEVVFAFMQTKMSYTQAEEEELVPWQCAERLLPR
jgi:hypothetical protein